MLLLHVIAKVVQTNLRISSVDSDFELVPAMLSRMGSVQDWRWRRERERALAAREAALKLAKQEDIRKTARLLATNLKKYDEIYGAHLAARKDADHELLLLEQRHLLFDALYAGLPVPEDYLEPTDGGFADRALSAHGETRLRRDLSSHRLSRAKDWVAVIMPVLSAIVAILGLLVALKRKRRRPAAFLK